MMIDDAGDDDDHGDDDDYHVPCKEWLQGPRIRDHSPESFSNQITKVYLSWEQGENHLKVARMDSQKPGGSTLGLVEQYLRAIDVVAGIDVIIAMTIINYHL